MRVTRRYRLITGADRHNSRAMHVFGWMLALSLPVEYLLVWSAETFYFAKVGLWMAAVGAVGLVVTWLIRRVLRA